MSGEVSAGRLQELGLGTLDCVHCGLCLPACPTYRETGREAASPRGRIYLMRAAAEGRIPLAGALADEASLCLGCRACETACPSGVRYGRLLEQTRAAVREAGLRTAPAQRLESLALRHLAPHRGRLALLFGALALAQRLRLDRLAASWLPRPLSDWARSSPQLPGHRERRLPSLRVPAEGRRRGRVGLLLGCVAAQLFADVNRATLRVLARNGFEVVVPRSQGCCGALHAHAGDSQAAAELAARNLRAFSGVDVVVTNSAGCGAALREAGDWLPGAGEAFAAGVRDVSELLDGEGLRPPRGSIDARVCYDDPCHLVHGQRVAAAPRRLLAAIPGLELVDHADAAGCCGAAGTYSLTQPEMAEAVLERKLDALAEVDPDLVASGNPGCLLQLRRGLAGRGLRARVVHPVELLDRAYEARPRRRIL